MIFDKAITWLMVYDFMISLVWQLIYWFWDEVLEIWWWLRSTTGPYGWPVLEVAYMETVISLHRGYFGDVSLGRVVGVSTWLITHGWHTRVNTSIGTIYNILWFSWYEINPIGIMFLKPIHLIKEHWWPLTLSWPDEVQRTFFNRSWVLKEI